MTINEILKLAKPFLEEESYSLNKLVMEYPELKKELDQKVTEMTAEYEADIKAKGLYFVVNRTSWKNKKIHHEKTLRLSYVGKENLPLISVDI